MFFRSEPSTRSDKALDGGYVYADPKLEAFRKSFEDEETYQSIHRIRPALAPKKIYVFGLVPENIKEEFEVPNLYFEMILLGVW